MTGPPARDAGLLDRVAALLQCLIPHHALSRIVHWLARQPLLSRLMINTFVAVFDVDLKEAAESDPRRYRHFNAFFTRALRPDARTIDAAPDVIVSPVDGCVSQVGRIVTDRIFQAKGCEYGLLPLLGRYEEMAVDYVDGSFATLYLAPRDYHRVHMPCDGRLARMLYIPGRLFAVNRRTVRSVDRLFTRNERVICLFDSARGPFAVIMIGALLVGSMSTVFSGQVTPRRPRALTAFDAGQWHYPEFARGAELGRFAMGSTVILLFPPQTLTWDSYLVPEACVRVGRRIGTAFPQADPRYA